jgi:hypothetical protein
MSLFVELDRIKCYNITTINFELFISQVSMSIVIDLFLKVTLSI